MRLSTTYKLAGPKTFRRSSTKILGRWGTNVQNFEKSIRIICEPDGYQKESDEKCLHWLKTGETGHFTQEELEILRVFVQTDQAGAEALIVAYECDAADYRQLFIHNVKPHVYVAMKLFKDIWTKKMKEYGGLIEDFDIDILCATPIAKLKQNSSWRDLDLLIKSSDNWPLTERYYYLAKQTVHSSNYGIRWSNFIMNVLEKSGGKIVLTPTQGKYFLETYHSLFPEIEERNRRIGRQVEQGRMLFNIFGFPYTITDYNILDTKLKEYFAWSAQSSVGEITRIAVSRMQEFIEDRRKKWDFMVDCHDSMLHQCPIYEVQECIAKQKETMNQKLISPNDGSTFFMKSECNVGFNWSSYKPEVNELGLRELTWN
jgi:hypothetical protein